MKKLLLMIAAMFVLAACTKDSVNDNPGHNDRPDNTIAKKVVVISDIHMSDNRAIQGGWAWFTERRSVLINFLHDIASKPAEYGTLVVAGDMFDEWVAPMPVSPYQNLEGKEVRNESDQFQVMVRDNKDVLDAFREVRKAGIELVYVPGNHDLTCTKEDFDTYLPGLFTQARDAFGLGAYTPADMPEVIIEHGHRYDYNNMPNPISTPGGYYPIGYVVSKYACSLHYTDGPDDNANAGSVFDNIEEVLLNPQTKLIYEQFKKEHGLENGLTYEQFCQALFKMKNDIDTVKGLISLYLATGQVPNGIDETLNHFVADVAWLVVMIAKPPHNFEELLTVLFTPVKFPEPYAEAYLFSDILPYFQEPVLFQNLWTNANWGALQQTNRVPVMLPFIGSVLAGGVDAVLDAIAPIEYFDNPKSDKRIVVFGHTHKGMITEHENAASKKCLYANTGCWVDNRCGDPEKGVTFQTYVELEKKGSTYTVTLKEWGEDMPLDEQTVSVK